MRSAHVGLRAEIIGTASAQAAQLAAGAERAALRKPTPPRRTSNDATLAAADEACSGSRRPTSADRQWSSAPSCRLRVLLRY